MDEYISSLKCAHQRYKDAFTVVLAEFSAATGQFNNDLATDLTIHSLNKHIERFILAFDLAMQLPSTLLQHIDDNIYCLRYAHQSLKDYLAAVLAEFNNAAGGHHINDLAMESAIQNLNEQHEHFIFTCKTFRAFIAVRFQHVRELVLALPANAVDPNATVAAPVSPDNAWPRDCFVLSSIGQGDMESDTRHRDEADVPKEHKAALSQALADLDLNRPEPEETVGHRMAASQVLPDLQPNENA